MKLASKKWSGIMNLTDIFNVTRRLSGENDEKVEKRVQFLGVGSKNFHFGGSGSYIPSFASLNKA